MDGNLLVIVCAIFGGLPVGILQCHLLRRFMKGYADGKIPMWVFPVKSVLWLATALIPCLIKPIAAVAAIASSVTIYAVICFATRIWSR